MSDKPDKPGKPGKPPQTGVGKMASNKCVVSVKTEVPQASAEWVVDLGDDLKQSLIYGNLAYDLVAAVCAKLGVEYSKYLVGESSESQFAETMGGVLSDLKAGTVAG